MSTYNKYPYVWLWGRMMGSDDSYIRRQMKQAEKDRAPETATYKIHGSGNALSSGAIGEWSDINICSNPHTLADLLSLAQRAGLPQQVRDTIFNRLEKVMAK